MSQKELELIFEVVKDTEMSAQKKLQLIKDNILKFEEQMKDQQKTTKSQATVIDMPVKKEEKTPIA